MGGTYRMYAESEKLTDMQNADAYEKAEEIVRILYNKLGRDIAVYDVKESTSIADYYVICSATNKTQVHALADEVSFQMNRHNVPHTHYEGRNGDEWMLLDYDDVVVHIFGRDAREFYNLERLLRADGKKDITAFLEQLAEENAKGTENA